MERKPNLTIDDIARELGVSKTTVSRAISGKGRISAATRERVQQYIKKYDYHPCAAAKGLAKSRTYNIALVLPRSLFKLDMPFIRKSMGAVCEEAFLQDYNVLICLSSEDNLTPLLRILDDRKVDGVILSRTIEDDPLVELLVERSIPFATIGSLPAALNGKATVEADHDHVGGCRGFTMGFLRSNPGKVALLGRDMRYIVNQSRLEGFLGACAAFGLTEEETIVRHGLRNRNECIEVLNQLLAQGVRSFLAMDDDLCMTVVNYLDALGMTCPKDYRIGSFYESDALAAHDPPVYSLYFDPAELGRVACRELLHSLSGEEHNPSPTLGYRIMMRYSF